MLDRTDSGRTATITAILTVVVWLGLPDGAAAAPTSKPIRPTGFAEAIRITVEGKDREYWTLEHGRPVTFTVRGPGRVKVITRLALPNATRGGSYEVTVHEGADEIVHSKFRVLPAVDVHGAGVPAWGRHRNVTFRVPPGSHTYRVDVVGDGAAVVAARPRYLRPRPSKRRVSISPTEYERVLTIVRSEKEISYYHLTPDAPMTVTIVGPTKLQVNTRLDFDRQMKGSAHGYAIEVRDHGEPVSRTSYVVTRSQVASYGNRPDIVPGVVKNTTVQLGEGIHELEIRLKDTIAPGVAVKLYIPAEDAK